MSDSSRDPGEGGEYGGRTAADPESTIDDSEIIDELPEDLDMYGFVGPRVFPNNNRRRIPAILYLLLGAGAVALYAAMGESSPLVNQGVLWAGVVLVVFGAYGFVAGWTLVVEESDALVNTAADVGYPLGHAAAQMVWRGWLSRPTWRILAYSDDDPPTHRAIAVIDGVSGEIVESFSEENPEDWSEFDERDRSMSGHQR